MARLAFFTERLPTSDSSFSREEITGFSYDLMTSLADQQHDVRVFSTYREDDTLPPTHSRLQIIRPFRNWSWLEIPRLVPILLDFQPEILHFIQPRKEAFSGLTNAMTALPSLGPVVGKPRIVVSLYDVRKEELQRNRSLLVFADTIIVANRQQADEVSRWFGSSRRIPTIEIVTLPGIENFESRPEREVMPGLEQLQSTARRLILIPGDLDERQDLETFGLALNELLSAVPSAGLVFGGGWGRLSTQARRTFMRLFEDRGNGARFLLTGPLTVSGEQTALHAASLVLLSGISDASLSLARWIRLALKASRPLALNEAQCRLDPIQWRHRENAFIVPDDPQAWGPILSDALLNDELRRDVRQRLPDFARTEAVDQPSNAISRIYAQVLRAPRKPLR